jgi:hypothetical protein
MGRSICCRRASRLARVLPCVLLATACGPHASTDCTIDGTTYSEGAPDPAAECRSCQPPRSTSDWTDRAFGEGCSDGGICIQGTCQHNWAPDAGPTCTISGVRYPAGAPNPSHECQICEPATSDLLWTNLTMGEACTGGTCTAGECYRSGAPPDAG